MPRELLWIAVVVLAALAGALWAGVTIGRLREREAQAKATRRAQRLARAWERLDPSATVWSTDAAGGVVRFDVAGTPAGPVHASVGKPLVDRVTVVAGPTLAELMARRLPLTDIPVLDAGRPCRLHAVPLQTDEGDSAGWLGLLRAEPAMPAAPAPAIDPPPAAAPAPAAAEPSAAEDALSFSYTVSHDLRAPLRVVDGFARILKEDHASQLDRVGNDHLDRVLAAAARMNQMIDALLAMARLSTQPLARQPVDLSQMAQFVVEDLRRGAPERRIEIHIDPGMTVQGDPTLLRQVVENLIGNAWKYTQRAEEPRLAFTCEFHEGKPCYLVRDNGAGFDMRGADRLFGLFQRLHSASDFPGTGVGLASVKRIVVRHGGRIWARSEPGHGAVFSFTLGE